MAASSLATFQAFAANDWVGFVGPRGLSGPPFNLIEVVGAVLGWGLNRRRAKLTRLAGALVGAAFLVWLYKAHIYANYDPTTHGSGATLRADYAQRIVALFYEQYTRGVLTDGWAFLPGYNAVGLGSLGLYVLARWRDGDRVTLKRAAKRERRGLGRWRRAMKAYEWRTRKVVQVHSPEKPPAVVLPSALPPELRLPPPTRKEPQGSYGESWQATKAANTSGELVSPNVAEAGAAAGTLLAKQESARQAAAPIAPPPLPPVPASSLPITTTLTVPAGHVLVTLGGNYMIVPLTALPPALQLDAKRLRFAKVRGFFGVIFWCINAVLNTLRTTMWIVRAVITLSLPVTLLILWFYGKDIMYWAVDNLVEFVYYLLHRAAPRFF